jgi:hypothetical protein
MRAGEYAVGRKIGLETVKDTHCCIYVTRSVQSVYAIMWREVMLKKKVCVQCQLETGWDNSKFEYF